MRVPPLLAAILAVPVAVVVTGAVMPANARPSVVSPQAVPYVCTSSGNSGVGDGSIDADNIPDVAVGVLTAGGVGQVDVHYTGIGQQHLSQDAFPGSRIGANFGNGFGSALAAMDLDNDGCSELIVGVPDTTEPQGTGSVMVLPGSLTGLYAGSYQVLASSVRGDSFGASVATARRINTNGFVADIWVGAPDRTVSTLAGAGAVDHYTVSASGVITYFGTITKSAPHSGAHFGAVLTASDDLVVIGAPDDMVDGQTGAGSVTYVTVDNVTGASTSAVLWSQDSGGVPGAAEAGDHFGAALASRGPYVVVGVPGEDVGSLADAGAVQIFFDGAPGAGITQDSAGVPGTAEAGDEFGASVAAGIWLSCQEVLSVAVGSPGEDVGSVADAGSVTLAMSISGAPDECPAQILTQGSGGLGGTAEKGDRVGASLSILRGDDGDEEDVKDQLLIGAPGEDVGSVADAGIVLLRSTGRLTTYEYSAGVFKNTRFGTVLATPGGGPEF